MLAVILRLDMIHQMNENMKLSDIAEKLPLVVQREGEFSSLGKLSQDKPQQLVYISSKKYLNWLKKKTNVSCVITTGVLGSQIPSEMGLGTSDNPERTFFEFHNHLATTNFYHDSFKTKISNDAKIHPTVFVAEKNVIIGQGSIIGPQASILENTIIKDNVFIGPGTTVGLEGTETKRFDNLVLPITHTGGVIINNNAEIKSNCCIGKGLFGDFTEIGEYTKIDSLSTISHNSVIGNRCHISSLVSVNGSAKIGDDVFIGPSASISNQVSIGNGAIVSIGAVVVSDVKNGQKVTGNFAVDHSRFIAHYYEIQKKYRKL